MDDAELRTPWFNQVTDRYLTTGTMSSADYDQLTPTQKTAIQWLKRAFARLNNNND